MTNRLQSKPSKLSMSTFRSSSAPQLNMIWRYSLTRWIGAKAVGFGCIAPRICALPHFLGSIGDCAKGGRKIERLRSCVMSGSRMRYGHRSLQRNSLIQVSPNDAFNRTRRYEPSIWRASVAADGLLWSRSSYEGCGDQCRKTSRGAVARTQGSDFDLQNAGITPRAG